MFLIKKLIILLEFFKLKKNILLYIICSPLIGFFIILSSSKNKHNFLKLVALISSSISFLLTIILWGFFNKSLGIFQHVVFIPWLPFMNINLILGVDGISILFLLLNTFLISLCVLSSWSSINHNLKEFLMAFLILDFFLIGAFCSLDLLLFYIFFESVIIPMYLIIGIWGSRERKILAAYYFFLYTLLGSTLMIVSIIYVYKQVGSTHYEVLLTFNFSKFEQSFLWLTFFFAFASKIPMVPMHLWLPEAHVEAPTAGSVLLAGVLLKLGAFGFIRFSLPLFPYASFYYAPLVDTLAVIGIIYTSFTAIRQTDFKRIIAYTSIAHMNLVVLGIFSFNSIGIEGAILQSLSHGFVASALFVIIGIVYERHNTKIVYYYGGLTSVMPIFSTIFLFFTLANMAFPGTSSFVGEFLILTGSFVTNKIVTIFGATGIIISGAYSLWLFNRIAYGNLKTLYINNFIDVSPKEFCILVPLIIGTLFIGFYPNFFLTTMHMSVNYTLELIFM